MTHTQPQIVIAPSILDADLGHMAEGLAQLAAAGADWIHLDVMDGHFVPNLSIGVPVVASIRQHTRLFLDTHLMITDPGDYAAAFAEAGTDSLTFHIEVTPQPMGLIEQFRELGLKVGVALNPGTGAEAVMDILEHVDVVLVMTVWPGFGGQTFMTQCLEKISAIAEKLRPDQRLQVDGGINKDTAALAVAAGANTLVAGRAIVAAEDPARALAEIRESAQRAR